jgi:hypothetical protein
MRGTTRSATAAVAVVLAQVMWAQGRMTPTAPGTPGDPVRLRMSRGLRPIVIVVKGANVGAFMPVAQ